jgi:hypothetical protein
LEGYKWIGLNISLNAKKKEIHPAADCQSRNEERTFRRYSNVGSINWNYHVGSRILWEMDFCLSSCRPVLLKSSSINVNGGSQDEEPSPAQFDRPGQESKLELFGFDSLVNILGLRRYITLFNDAEHFTADF